MRAIIIASGLREGFFSLLRYRPTGLLRIGDKPMLYHVMDFLSARQMTSCELIVSYLPASIEEKVASGSRWGLQVTYHLAKKAHYPLSAILPVMEQWPDEPFLIGTADCLPAFAQDLFDESAPRSCLFDYPSKKWSGWAVLRKKELAAVPYETRYDDLHKALTTSLASRTVRPFLSVQTLIDLKKSNEKVLKQKVDAHFFPSTAKEVEEGVWISRAVSLHQSVKVNPPVFIGENSQIKEEVEIGPNAIIENHCIVDKASIIKDALVCQRSYVGEGLVLEGCIVDRNLLINMKHEAEIRVVDEFILCELKPFRFNNVCCKFCERLLAATALVVLSPIYLLIRMNCGIKEKRAVKIPSPRDPLLWNDFSYYEFAPKDKKRFRRCVLFFRRLPYLWAIMSGYLHFVGVALRTSEELKALPGDWQKLYLQAKAGLITLEAFNDGKEATKDDRYAAEAYYAVHQSFFFDLKLFFRYLLKKLGMY